MSEIVLKAIYEHLVPLMEVVQYQGESLQRGGAALGSGSDHGLKSYYNVDINKIKDCGPVVEIGWSVAHEKFDGKWVEVGATVMMAKTTSDEPLTIWVERNSHSGKPHGNLYVEVADPKSFDKIVEFLT